MIYLHFNILVTKNITFLSGSEPTITWLHNFIFMNSLQLLLIGKKKIKGLYKSNKSV